MPRVKIPRKSTLLDMTAMCDVAFLLLTFFMLTSNFIQKEPVAVSTPSSISQVKIPERNIMMILIDAKGKVFFGIDGQENREKLLTKMGETYNVIFTPKELKDFSVINSFGVPMNLMKQWLDMPTDVRDRAENAIGIPCDSLDNQFKNWVSAAMNVNKDYRVAIKGDRAAAYPVVKKLMGTLQDLTINRYNLITSLENAPDLEKSK
jgi:biopolymer transport protein ExbD